MNSGGFHRPALRAKTQGRCSIYRENSLRSRTGTTYLFSDLSEEAHRPLVTHLAPHVSGPLWSGSLTIDFCNHPTGRRNQPTDLLVISYQCQ
jgi:hypothetical protein